MAPAVTRELSIVYGGITVGGTTDRLLDGAVVVREGPDSATLDFSFVTTTATEAAFATEIAAIETAFRTPRQRLRVVQGSETLYDWNPATDSGFNQFASLSHPPNDANSGRSRYYEVTIEVGLPADEYSTDARRDSTVTLDFTPARKRSIILDVTYTALTGTDARAQYNAAIATYQTTITSALGGTWELVEESVETDDQNKICNARRTILEIIYNESAGTLNDPDIARHELSVTVNRQAPGDSPQRQAKRVVELSVVYSAWIDKDRTQDLRQKYDSLRGYIFQAAVDQVGRSAGALIDEAPTFDLTENRISATMTIWCLDGSSLLEYRETLDISRETGVVFLPVWTGGVYDRYIYQGPATERITLTIVERLAGRISGGRAGLYLKSGSVGLGGVAAFGSSNSLGASFSRPGRRRSSSGGSAGIAGAYLVSTRQSTTPLTIGSAGRTLDVEDITTVEVYERATPYAIAKGTPGEKVTDG